MVTLGEIERIQKEIDRLEARYEVEDEKYLNAIEKELRELYNEKNRLIRQYQKERKEREKYVRENIEASKKARIASERREGILRNIRESQRANRVSQFSGFAKKERALRAEAEAVRSGKRIQAEIQRRVQPTPITVSSQMADQEPISEPPIPPRGPTILDSYLGGSRRGLRNLILLIVFTILIIPAFKWLAGAIVFGNILFYILDLILFILLLFLIFNGRWRNRVIGRISGLQPRNPNTIAGWLAGLIILGLIGVFIGALL